MMNFNRFFEKTICRPVEICACGAGVLALLSGLSWLFNDWKIAAFGADYVPMAPSTAWSMILLSCAVFLYNRRLSSPVIRCFAFFTVFSVGAIALLFGTHHLFHFEMPLERWLTPSTPPVGHFPSGRMSPLTAATFLGAVFAFCLELPPFSRRLICRQTASLSALAVSLAGLLVVLSYAVGMPLLYNSHMTPMALPTAISFAMLGMGIMITAGFDTAPLSFFGIGSPATSPASSRWHVFGFFSAFLLISAVFGIIGYQYFKHQIEVSRQAAQNELSAIADLKVRQIIDWRIERLSYAQVIEQEPFFRQAAQNFFADPNDSDLRFSLSEWLKSVREHNQSLRVLLLDAQLNVRLASPEDKTYFGPTAAKFSEEALHSNSIVTSDLHRSRFSGEIHFDLAIPLDSPTVSSAASDTKKNTSQKQPLGVLLLEVDPCKFLYPLIQDWPTPSLTAETMLVRREGDDVVYLNELRHRKDTALVFRLPIGQHRNVPAALAAEGREGVIEGLDYRNVPVLAVARGIPNTPWHLLAKVDQDEIYAPLRERAWTTVIILLAIFLAAGSGAGLLWRRRDNRWLHSQLAIEQEHRLILDSTDEGIIGLDAQGRHVFVNPAACRMLGYGHDELIGKSSHDVWHYQKADGTPYPSQDCPIYMALETGTTCHLDQEVFWRKDGTSFPVECTATPSMKNDRPVALVLVFRDMSDRKRAEKELQKREQRYRVLFERSSDALMTAGPPTWRFTSANPAAVAMFGAGDEAQFLSFAPWDVSPEHQPDGRVSAEKTREIIETTMQEGSRFFEWTFQRLGGEAFPATVMLTRVEVDGEPAFLATVRDITAEKRVEEEQALAVQRMESLLALNRMGDQPLDVIIAQVVEDSIRVTQSKIGYLAMLNEDESVLTMQYWSKSAHTACEIVDKPIVYPIEQTGLWGEAVRQRKPIITNDYAAPHPSKRGTPEGHVPITRHMNIPVFDGDRIVAIAGVGNKCKDYDDRDLRQLQLLMEGWQHLAIGKRAEAEMAFKNVLLLTQQEVSIDGILAVDSDDKVILRNQRFNELWKIPPELADSKADAPILKANLDQVVNPEAFLEKVRFLYDHRYEKSHDEIVLKDGKVFDRYSAPMFGTDNQYYGRIWYFRDVTEHKRSEAALLQAKQDWERTFDAVPDLISILDKDYRILRANKAMAAKLEKAPHECEGLTCYRAVHGLDAPPDYCPHKRLLEDGGFHFEEVCENRLGGNFAVSTSPLCNVEGKLIGCVHIARDVNESKTTERELARYRDHLAELVRERTEELEHTKKLAEDANRQLVFANEHANNLALEAKQASQAKSHFLATMSHELRTPLNGVIGMTELMSNTRLDDRQRRFTDACHSSAVMLLQLINDILDFSKIEAGKLELDLHEFSLTQIVEDTVQLLAAKAYQKKLELICYVDRDCQCKVLGDGNRLRQVIVNLLGNAVKFTAKGEVCMRVSAIDQGPGWIVTRFEVADTGIGIPPDRINRLFQAFSQVDSSTTRKYGGTGLGLTISKSLVAAMGGSLDVESKEGAGSTFHFAVKFETTDVVPLRDVRLLTELHHLRALVVIANKSLNNAVTEYLSGWGLQTTSADSTTDAIAHLRDAVEESFQLVVIDEQVAGVESGDFAQAIRQDPTIHQPSLIVLTPFDRHAECQKQHQPANCRYVDKPVCQSPLFNAIVELCSHSQRPADRPIAKSPETNMLRSRYAGNVRILLAEDNSINQMYCLEVLHQAGLECDGVSNGCEAVEAVQSCQYHLILMDCHMPEMDGYEASWRIRRQELAESVPRHIPIIALTANAIKGDREACLEAGMDDYLSKPFEGEELIEMIDRLLDKSTATNAIKPVDAVSPPAVPQVPVEGHKGDLSPLDFETLLRRCMGNAAFAESLLGELEASGPGQIDILTQHIQAGAARAAADTAHALKGAAGIVGAEPLRAVAAEIEIAGKSGDIEQAASLLQEIQAEMRRCLMYLPEIRSRLTSMNLQK